MPQKQACYEQMINSLKKTKEKEVSYKEAIDIANSFLVDFRKKIVELIDRIM